MKNKIISSSTKIVVSLALAFSGYACDINHSNLETTQNQVISVSNKKGASFSFVINEKSFGTKATANTVKPPKLNSNISYYKVYLLKNATSPYPANADPVTDSVYGPFTISKTGVSQTVTFNNVIDSAGGFYFAGVRAYDTSNNEIIKPNTSWTGAGALLNRIAVSSVGLTVNALNVVSTTTPLSVTLNLDDGLGARIDTSIGFSPSGTLGGTRAPSGSIFAIAGNQSKSNGFYQNATSISLNNPLGATVDSIGNVYIVDNINNLIEKIDTAGKIKVIAGNSVNTGVKADTTGTQNATAVSLNNPFGVAVDNSGNVYIADYYNYLVEKIDTSGKIKVVAGNSFTTGVKADTTGTQNATSISLNNPVGVTVDSTGNVYIADYSNHLVEKIDTAGKIKVIAGNFTNTGIKPDASGVQNATSISLYYPVGVTVDSTGNVYIADSWSHLVEKVDTAGKIKVIAGNSFFTGVKADTTGTQNATSISLNNPVGVAVDNSGNTYITDYSNHLVEKIDTSGKIKVIAGNSTNTGIKPDTTGTQNATSISLNNPLGATVDSIGNVYISDQYNHLVEKIDTAGKIKVIAGNSFTTGVKPDTTGTQNAISVSLNGPAGISIDNSGNLYISDFNNHLVEKIDTSGKIKVIAGNSFSTGLIADTTGIQNATSISLNYPSGVTVDSTTGNVYIADSWNHLVEKIDTAGKIKVIAGNSFNTGVKADTTGTQNATSVSLNNPTGVAVDSTGNVYISDFNNQLVEKIDTTGKIKVIAGNSFTTGIKPDASGVQNATSVGLNHPVGVVLDNSGNVYIANYTNHLVEKIDTVGKIKIIAGNSFTTGSKSDTTGTQNATSVSLCYPHGVTVDITGNVYIVDLGNNLIERVDTAGKIKVITGNSFTTGVKADTTGTQNATSISLNSPSEVTVDSSGNVYIADYGNNLVAIVVP